MLGNGFAKRLVGSVVFPSEFGPAVQLRVANLLWRQRIAGRTREGFPAFGKGVVGEISEFDAEGQRTGLHNPLVIGVPSFIRLVRKGLDSFNDARVKTRPKQVGGFQRGIFQRGETQERRRGQTLTTPVGPNECWRNEYTLLNFLEKTQNIFLFTSFCRRDYSQNRVQGSYSKRTMVRNRNPMWARVIGFKDDMTSFLIYVRIPKVLAQHFDQIHTA